MTHELRASRREISVLGTTREDRNNRKMQDRGDPARQVKPRKVTPWAESNQGCQALAFMGSATVTTYAPPSDALIVRAARGFSHSKAINAAMRSHAIMAQKTLVQEPVFSNSQAAPMPAKNAPAPLAV